MTITLPRYKSEQVELYCGDCLEILPQLEAGSIDAVVTDPPYGIDYDSTHKKYKNGKDYGTIKWNKEKPDLTPILELKKSTILWGGNCFSSQLPENPGWLVWVKINRNNTHIRQSEVEIAWTNFIQRPQAFRYIWIGAGMEGEGNAVYGGLEHPTQKPITLMRWCIDFTTGTVLDPFMGSGTTGVAAVQLGRKFIGIEIDEKYYAIAEKRIREAQLQMRLPL